MHIEYYTILEKLRKSKSTYIENINFQALKITIKLKLL